MMGLNYKLEKEHIKKIGEDTLYSCEMVIDKHYIKLSKYEYHDRPKSSIEISLESLYRVQTPTLQIFLPQKVGFFSFLYCTEPQIDNIDEFCEIMKKTAEIGKYFLEEENVEEIFEEIKRKKK